MVASNVLSALQQRLIRGLELLPDGISLCLLNGKKVPQGTDWQNKPYSKAEVNHAIAHGIELENSKGEKYRFYPQGYGLMVGYPITVNGEKRYLLILDQDGSSARRKIEEMSGGNITPTVKTTSGRKDRCHRIYYVAEEYAPHLQTKKIATGELGEDGKLEHVEFLWLGRQAVLPPSVHPTTGCYQYLDCSAFDVDLIAHAPDWVVEQMLKKPQTSTRPKTSYTAKLITGEAWTDEEWALSYLSALSSYRADDYDDWVAVGMALHSVSESLFDDWENWSRQSPKYKPGDCEKKWKSFKRSGVAIGTLAHMAKQDGWRSPFEKSSGRGYSSGDEGNRDYFSAKKLPLKEAAQKARTILQSNLDELTANIELEAVREACGMSGYDWERKIIKPLKRDLEGDRFKLELLGLLQIDDAVERIRQQALMAPKYQMSSSLIEKAMSAMKQRTQTPESKALDLDELFDLESEGLSWIIPGLLPEKETIVLAGAPKAGKTLLAIDAAYAVATGESYFLGEATKRGKVLLVSTDESANSTKTKLINRGFRRCDKDSIKVLPTWDITQMGTLETLLEDFRPDLVIIDSLRRINKGSEISENSAEFADAIYTLKETLERYGAAGILIHHTNKDREALGVHRLRGSSAIAGAVWGTWQLDQIPKPDPNNKKKFIVDPKDPTRTLSVFARDIEGQQLLIELNPENNSWIKAGEVGDSEEAQAERDTLRSRILNLLGIPTHTNGLSGSEIINRLDAEEVEKRSVYNCLNRMVTKRIITSKPAPGDKRYNIYSLPNCHTSEQSSANCHTQESSPPPPSPTPTDPVGDYYAESQTTVGFENSHQNSHHPKKNSHHLLVENPTDDYSNADREGDSEIVTTFDSERGGRGEKGQACVTVDRPELSHMQLTLVEQTASTSADEAIAPSPAPVAPEPVALTKSEAVDEAIATLAPVENVPEVVETVADDHAASEAEYEELKAKTDVELKRLNWDKQQGREYLLKVYGVTSRLFLNNEQLRDFLHYLESQQ